MREPIKAGDVCEVVGGLGRQKSPNIGLRVNVEALSGEHSTLGRVWMCTGEGVCQLSDGGAYIPTGWADFPAAWLKKIDPDAPPPAAVTTERELAHE